MILKDVFVQSCGWVVFPGVGFMVMGSGCLCRTLVTARGGLAGGAPATGARHSVMVGQTCRYLQRWIRPVQSPTLN